MTRLPFIFIVLFMGCVDRSTNNIVDSPISDNDDSSDLVNVCIANVEDKVISRIIWYCFSDYSEDNCSIIDYEEEWTVTYYGNQVTCEEFCANITSPDTCSEI